MAYHGVLGSPMQDTKDFVTLGLCHNYFGKSPNNLLTARITRITLIHIRVLEYEG